MIKRLKTIREAKNVKSKQIMEKQYEQRGRLDTMDGFFDARLNTPRKARERQATTDEKRTPRRRISGGKADVLRSRTEQKRIGNSVVKSSKDGLSKLTEQSEHAQKSKQREQSSD